MSVIKEVDFPRYVDEIAITVTQNIWADGAASYSLFDGSTGELLRDEDYDHMPTDTEVREALKDLEWEND